LVSVVFVTVKVTENAGDAASKTVARVIAK
jgi:hypothetical protein